MKNINIMVGTKSLFYTPNFLYNARNNSGNDAKID